MHDVEEEPLTFVPRGQSQGFILDQIEAFMNMQALGSPLIDALVACVSGQRMTPDISAQCIQSYWRRYSAVIQLQESRGAALLQQMHKLQSPRLAVRF